jgi:hypothetical protein
VIEIWIGIWIEIGIHIVQETLSENNVVGHCPCAYDKVILIWNVSERRSALFVVIRSCPPVYPWKLKLMLIPP